MGYFEERRVPHAKLFTDALVTSSKKGQRSSQCCETHFTYFEVSWIFVSDAVQSTDKHYGRQRQSYCGWWFPWGAHLQVFGPTGVAFCSKVAADENDITNAVDIYHTSSGSTRVVAANNDAQVRVFDGGNFICLSCFSYPWSVNNTSVSPDGKSLAVLGDSADCLIADAQSGKVLSKLKGHLDYSFASAWHPSGQVLATGNQDTTCRLWDVRNLSESFAVLKGRMGAIRAIRFTSDGQFMAMAEPADFVHIFDTRSDYCLGQEIDLFGEIAGISFSPDTEALFVGIADRTYGSLLEFNRRRQISYVDCMI